MNWQKSLCTILAIKQYLQSLKCTQKLFTLRLQNLEGFWMAFQTKENLEKMYKYYDLEWYGTA